MSTSLQSKIGILIQEARANQGLTQAQLAKSLGTSQSAVNRIEKGKQNVSLDMISRIGKVLETNIMALGDSGGTMHFKVTGGNPLKGAISVKSSKNAAVSLLCAALLNRKTTVLRQVARIEEVNRILEVLNSIGVKTKWLNAQNDLEIIPPARLKLENMNIEAARKTRTVIMMLGPLLHLSSSFKLPFAGGCNLGNRTVEPHMAGLAHFGLEVKTTTGYYHASVKKASPKNPIILTERGDTVTENILMAAAASPTVTIIKNASSNYMVQDLCLFLSQFGVKIDGIGTTTLTIRGVSKLARDVEYWPSEDPIEAMTLLTAGIVTKSTLTVKRVPIEFMEIELQVLKDMGLKFSQTPEYKSKNGYTKVVDVTVKPSELVAPKDKIHPLPFPGLNIDNLPFFAVLAACAKGRTLVHDWVYENRAIYFMELTKLNASMQLLDPHRVYIEGPTKWRPAEIITPPALRPAVVILIAMLAASGVSTLRNVYSINRGYEDLAERLNGIGAQIQTLREA